jgi:hypothetical protein
MRYMANSRIAAGASRERLAEFFDESSFSPAAMDLIRRRVAIEYAFKEGDVPGVVVFLEADSADEVAALLDGLPVVEQGLVTFDIDPLGKTMHLQPAG